MAQLIEPGRVVVAHPAGQDLRLPGPDRGLVALELADDPGEAVDAAVLGGTRDVLPLPEEAHELIRADRLDALASLRA